MSAETEPITQGMEVINLDDTAKTQGADEDKIVPETTEEVRQRTLREAAAEKAGEVIEYTKATVGAVKDNVSAGYTAAATRIGEATAETRKYTGEKYTQVAENVRNVVGGATTRVSEKLESPIKYVGETYEGSKKRVTDTYESTSKVVGETYNATKEVVGEKYEKTKEVVGEKYEKTKEVVGEKYEKTKEVVGETAQKVAEKTGEVWEAGKGQVIRVKDATKEVAGAAYDKTATLWNGDAAATLARAKNEKEFKDLKVQGAEELEISAWHRHTQPCIVPPGKSLKWLFRVQQHNIGFSVSERVQVFGGSEENEVLKLDKYENNETAKGQWTNNGDKEVTLVLIFDNTYSKMRSKKVAYLYGLQPASETVAMTPTPPADDEQDKVL